MGMGDVVAGLSQSHAGGAYVGGGAWAIRIGFDFIPKSIEISTCCHVVDDGVKRIGDPISGRRGVTLQQSLRGNGADHKVVLDDVVCLNTVLHENVVSSLLPTLLHMSTQCLLVFFLLFIFEK